MADTRQNLDIQSDKVLTQPTVQTRMVLKDSGATQSLFVDWDEPAVADRTVNFEDPGGDDAVVYKDLAQVLQNKQITTVPAAGDDVTNKTYVDAAIIAGLGVATSGSGGGTTGTLTMDSDKGLLITAAVAEVKVDGTTIQFDGSGNLEVFVDATGGSGGATKGLVTGDTDKGLDITAGVAEVKVDGVSVQFNGAGELEFITAPPLSATGTVSGSPTFTENIIAVTPPVNGSTASGDISTLDFENGVIEGTRFAIPVPDDYFTGGITLSVVQQMDAADVAGSIEIETTAKIIDVTNGVIDSASYPATQSTLAVPVTTVVERRDFLTIADGDFAPGDVVQVLYKRLGNDVGDTNLADQQVLMFQFAYIAIINGRVANRQVKFFENAVGETATTPATISAGDVTVEEFPTAIDTGLKFDFSIPDNWDEISNAEIRLSYAMSVSDAAGVVRIEPRAKIARVTGGTIDTIAPTNFDFTPGAGASTVPKITSSIMSIPLASISKGDVVTVVVARRGSVGADTHTGDFQLLCASISFGVLPATTVGAITIREDYLSQGTFGNASGAGVSGDTLFPAFGGDFETFDELSSTVAAGTLDVAYEGRLGGLNTDITEIRFFVKGTGASPTYTLNVYAEGTGVVHTDGPNAAPVGSTEIIKTSVDLSAQPAGSKRFFVVVTANIDAGETVLVSRPFVRLE